LRSLGNRPRADGQISTSCTGDLPHHRLRRHIENLLRGKSNFTRSSSMFAMFKGRPENNSLFRKLKQAYVTLVPPGKRGVMANRYLTRLAGCDGRCGARDERAGADGEIVRSRSPDAGIKPCVTNARRRWPEARRTEETTYKP